MYNEMISITNQQGGICVSSTVDLAVGLVQQSRLVLAIDVDPHVIYTKARVAAAEQPDVTLSTSLEALIHYFGRT